MRLSLESNFVVVNFGSFYIELPAMKETDADIQFLLIPITDMGIPLSISEMHQ